MYIYILCRKVLIKVTRHHVLHAFCLGISYQSLFRLFDKSTGCNSLSSPVLRLSGMTGTAFTEAKEFEEVYKLKTVSWKYDSESLFSWLSNGLELFSTGLHWNL